MTASSIKYTIITAIAVLAMFLLPDLAFASNSSAIDSSFNVKSMTDNADTAASNLYMALSTIFAFIGFVVAAISFLKIKEAKNNGGESPAVAIGGFVIGSLMFSIILIIGAVNATMSSGNDNASSIEAKLRSE